MYKKAPEFRSKKKMHTFWLDPSVWEVLQRRAYETGLTLSDYVANLVNRDNKKKGKGK